MKDIYYKSSEGVIINLIQKPYKMLDDTDLFNWEWDYETVGSNYPYITAFKKQMVSRQFNLVISGSSETDMLNNIEHFVEVVDRDVRLNQAGKLYYGNYYRECFFTGHTKGKFLKKNISTHGFTIVAEDGDWKSTQDQSYSGVSGGKYINKYCVPSVSSNSDNYVYGANDEAFEGTLLLNEYGYTYLDLQGAETLEILRVDERIEYAPTNDDSNWSLIEPSDCPVTIDVSGIPYGVGMYFRRVVPSSSVLGVGYRLTPEEETTIIDWSPDSSDTEAEFKLDLGAVTELKSISGLTIARVGANRPTISLEISADDITWEEVDSAQVPSDYGALVELESSWSSSYPNARYIRVTGGAFRLRSKSFRIEAHLGTESVNIALSSIPYFSNIEQRQWNVGDTLQFQLIGTGANFFSFNFPEPSHITRIGSFNVFPYVEGVRITIYVITEQGTETVYDELTTTPILINQAVDLEGAIGVVISADKSVIYLANDFQILQTSEVSPHRYILNDNYVPSDAIIKIYGPTQAPSLMIGDNQYGAENITLDDGEFLEINTKDETIQHYLDSEGWVNVFNHRLDDTFEKIEVGTSEITWQGNLRVDIQLLNSRSDPKWN